LQTPQGLDATHGEELFPVKRDHIGTNSGVQRTSFGGSKIRPSHLETARHFEIWISQLVQWASSRKLVEQRFCLL